MFADVVSGELKKLGLAFCSALCSFLINIYPIRSILNALGFKVPFLGLALFGGFVFVFWISISYRMLGKNYGVITALLIVSLCLLVSPWYGITNPEWFGVYGLISFFLMGFLTERLNGGFGNSVCLLINWLALGYHHNIWVQADLGIALIAISFISGFVGNKLALVIVKLFYKPIQRSSNFLVILI